MSDIGAIGWKAHATEDGVYIRPVEGLEDLVSFLDSRGSSTIVSSAVSVKTSINNFEAVLRRAWVRLRNANPSLAVSVLRENNEGFLRYDANDTKEWLEETFFVHQQMTPEQMYCNTTPFKRTELHWFKGDGDHQEIYIRSIHENMDGMGVIHLTNQFLELVAASQNEQATEKDVLLNLAPPLRIAAGVGAETYAAEGGKILQDFSAGMRENAVSLPAKHSPSSAAEPGRLDMTLSSSTTRSILKACKERGITITHAYHAALALGLMKLNPPQEGHRIHTLPILISVRDRLLPPYRGSKRPTALYTTSQFLRMAMPEPSTPQNEAFLLLARRFKDTYTDAREDVKLIAIQKALMEMTVQFLAQMKSENTTASGSPQLSSLGNLDTLLKPTYGGLVVEKYFYGVQMRGSSQVVLWTFHGELKMAIFFDHGDFDQSFLAQLMEETRRTLLAGLGVEPNTI